MPVEFGTGSRKNWQLHDQRIMIKNLRYKRFLEDDKENLKRGFFSVLKRFLNILS